MSDNVIILGAGASVDAGIPLLSNFVDKMWELATRGTYKGKALSDDDKNIFNEAMKVRDELDGYHGRASFDDRNIEDILSILSFNLIGGDASDQDKLSWMTKAIARTIELTCDVKHDGALDKIQEEGNNIYKDFWFHLFQRFKNAAKSFPTIISFNYDLVLERSLFQALVGAHYSLNDDNKLLPFDGMNLIYQYKYVDDTSYAFQDQVYKGYSQTKRGLKLERCKPNILKHPVDIEILKLHGSLNFPSSPQNDYDFIPTSLANDPYIIPPIINKSISTEQTMWGAGIRRLREAKNIIIVGYSLPQTDIYIQYFIKAGIGPNRNLNKVYVFNPALARNSKENERMQERFGNCFSPQLKNRIEFYDETFQGFVTNWIDSQRVFFS